MSIKIKESVPLNNIDEFKTWTEIFDAQARGKCLTDQFLSNAGLKELIKIKKIVAPKDVTSLKWDDIKSASITNFLEPKKRLLIAERTVFMQMKQLETESVGEFAARLRVQAVKCEFHSFKNTTIDPSEELTRMRLIAGIRDDATRNKILEKELITKLTTEHIDFTMQLMQVKEFAFSERNEGTQNESINASTSIQSGVESCYQQERSNSPKQVENHFFKIEQEVLPAWVTMACSNKRL